MFKGLINVFKNKFGGVVDVTREAFRILKGNKLVIASIILIYAGVDYAMLAASRNSFGDLSPSIIVACSFMKAIYIPLIISYLVGFTKYKSKWDWKPKGKKSMFVFSALLGIFKPVYYVYTYVKRLFNNSYSALAVMMVSVLTFSSGIMFLSRFVPELFNKLPAVVSELLVNRAKGVTEFPVAKMYHDELLTMNFTNVWLIVLPFIFFMYVLFSASAISLVKALAEGSRLRDLKRIFAFAISKSLSSFFVIITLLAVYIGIYMGLSDFVMWAGYKAYAVESVWAMFSVAVFRVLVFSVLTTLGVIFLYAFSVEKKKLEL